MSTIPTYPPPLGPLDGTELLLGFASGATRRITVSELLDFVIASGGGGGGDALGAITDQLMGAWWDSLPIDQLPAGSKKFWINGGFLARTA